MRLFSCGLDGTLLVIDYQLVIFFLIFSNISSNKKVMFFDKITNKIWYSSGRKFTICNFNEYQISGFN
jgi:hypothetical protein